MSEGEVSIQVDVRDAVGYVFLNRPDVRNAFDDHAAASLVQIFDRLGSNDEVRAIVLGGRGPMFCAGGDLNWMKRVAGYTREQNMRDAAAFQQAFERIDRCPKPVVGRIQGAALGGGAGLVAVCDVAVTAEGTKIGFPEVRLGLVPGVISPYVLRKIGMSRTRHLFLTGERFDAHEALRMGLVHRVVPEDDLDGAVDRVLSSLKSCAPQAVRGAKELLRRLEDANQERAASLARQAITDARASDDGQEGLAAFLEKRRPGWLQ